MIIRSQHELLHIVCTSVQWIYMLRFEPTLCANSTQIFTNALLIIKHFRNYYVGHFRGENKKNGNKDVNFDRNAFALREKSFIHTTLCIVLERNLHCRSGAVKIYLYRLMERLRSPPFRIVCVNNMKVCYHCEFLSPFWKTALVARLSAPFCENKLFGWKLTFAATVSFLYSIYANSGDCYVNFALCVSSMNGNVLCVRRRFVFILFADGNF